MKIFIQLFVTLILFVNFANSQDGDLNSELKKASSITNSEERLRTYDSVLEKHGIRVKSSQTEEENIQGKWTVTEKTDPLDGKKIITFILHADSGKSYLVGRPISLVLRWTGGKTEVYINWGNYMSKDDSWVSSKFDDGAIEINSWNLSTDGTATFLPERIRTEKDPVNGIVRFKKRPKDQNKDEDDIMRFIKRLRDSKQLIARVTPFRESPLTAIFDTRGLEAAARPHIEHLKWF